MSKHLFMAALTLAFLFTTQSQAQSLKDLFNKENVEKAVSTLTGENTANMEGTWIFTGSAVEFESDNLLQKAGGTVAATALEQKLNEQLERIGIKNGQLSFTFNADSTFQTTLGKKDSAGTYSYDSSTKEVALKFTRLLNLKAKLNCTSAQMGLLFNADKLLNLITMLTSKSNNATLQAINSLTENYDGMRLGLALEKKQ